MRPARAYRRAPPRPGGGRNPDPLQPPAHPWPGRRSAQGTMGQFGIDLANIHPYRGDGIPETAIAEKCPQGLKVLAPAMRVNSNCQVTEFGWALIDWTDLGDPQNGPSERVQATYMLRAFLDYFSKTGRTSYVHQIADLETG